MDTDLQNKIVKGEIDINNTELFVSSLLKALIYKLNEDIVMRNKTLEHFILNTGDDIMYLERKGYDHSKEPQEVTNENYIYNTVPRCIVNMDSINILDDQLTSPYTRGYFDLTYEDNTYGFNAEYRRMPMKLSVSLKYYLDSFTDALEVTQQIITKLLFIQNYKFSYMGQTMAATYKVPTDMTIDKNITFDGGTTDSKLRTIELELEVETNMPVYNPLTAIKNDNYISKLQGNIYTNKKEKLAEVHVSQENE